MKGIRAIIKNYIEKGGKVDPIFIGQLFQSKLHLLNDLPPAEFPEYIKALLNKDIFCFYYTAQAFEILSKKSYTDLRKEGKIPFTATGNILYLLKKYPMKTLEDIVYPNFSIDDYASVPFLEHNNYYWLLMFATFQLGLKESKVIKFLEKYVDEETQGILLMFKRYINSGKDLRKFTKRERLFLSDLSMVSKDLLEDPFEFELRYPSSLSDEHPVWVDVLAYNLPSDIFEKFEFAKYIDQKALQMTPYSVYNLFTQAWLRLKKVLYSPVVDFYTRLLLIGGESLYKPVNKTWVKMLFEHIVNAQTEEDIFGFDLGAHIEEFSFNVLSIRYAFESEPVLPVAVILSLANIDNRTLKRLLFHKVKIVRKAAALFF